MNQFTNFLTDPILQGLIWSILALGVFVAYRVLDIADLSVEGVFPLAAVCSIYFINSGWNPLLALLVTLIIGAVCGALTAMLHVYLKIPSLLAGIIMMTGLLTFVLVVSNGNISLSIDKESMFSWLYHLLEPSMGIAWGDWLANVVIIAAIVVLCLVFIYIFFGTKIGISIRATGKNKTMARACGINDRLMIIIGLAISSSLIALAGCIYAQQKTYASADVGKGTIVIGLATLFLGEVAFKRTSFKVNLISIVLGGFIYWYIIDAILIIPGFNANYLSLVQAGIMVLVMGVPYLIKLFKSRQEKRKIRGKADVKNI